MLLRHMMVITAFIEITYSGVYSLMYNRLLSQAKCLLLLPNHFNTYLVSTLVNPIYSCLHSRAAIVDFKSL